MEFPNFNEEKKLWRKGFNVVVGLDEAGRGPLAGPVVAAAITINPKFKTLNPKQIKNSNFRNLKRILDFDNLNLFRISDLGFWISQIKDSKQLSEKKREEIYTIITKHPAIEWGVGIVSEKIIDKINILEATKLAMQKAINSLNINFNKFNKQKILPRDFNDRENHEEVLKDVGFLLIDGNFTLRQAQGKQFIPQLSIIKGDQKVFSISAASIIAKVTRDRIMQKMHKKYPQYGFEKHKGYGTALHIKNLKNFGPCKIHRKTFFPVRSLDYSVVFDRSGKFAIANFPLR
ncbi:MAG: ribonuclease HII [Candidatus Staskawiczbacteria bacterium RIFCSPHIGHO2_02_FULL_34_10]|uniref:Ribonuclease HII n=2 Tax=Candidatus Staskawicziibacteriota TaxID=1817916 RepID=A0A1G2HKN6_9BACT|nr:MAG: ribonuclease HII [Candidatus Staskawiczbacteria bacterium RIFCSPHIGHO2_01_FULL_34_27]OGZ67467.1 MAG: ribonuclease HII [Candidatus Staskawiczbacteria bacterium RIFCSPHIGHO2_02_FULL_34_10]